MWFFYDVFVYVNEINIFLVFISVDQLKVFDRVFYVFLFKILDWFGFGFNFIYWIKVLYNFVFSMVKVNGWFMFFILFERGLR